MGQMAVMDRTGDTKIMWSKDNSDEIEAARATFDSLRKKGYAAFTVDDKGKQSEQITAFDPKLERIILVPAMRGG